MKSIKMRWVGNVVCMERGKVHTGFWWGNLSERDNLEDLYVDGGIALSGFLRTRMGGVEWINLVQDRG
jgi:hypothetical protein